MLALRVTINDRKTVIAGADDLSVLSAIVTLSGKLGRRAVARGRSKPDMFLHVGGLTARGKGRRNEHLRWTPHVKLRIGDRVVVELVESARSNKVVARYAAERGGERAYYKELKKQYLRLKAKYEPES